MFETDFFFSRKCADISMYSYNFDRGAQIYLSFQRLGSKCENGVLSIDGETSAETCASEKDPGK